MIRSLAFILLIAVPGASAMAQRNITNVAQAGESNNADVHQPGSGNNAAVEQAGTSNSVTVLQESDANTADVEQTGESNTTTIRQTNEEAGPFSGDHNSATVEQTGHSNIVSLDQKGGGYSTATVLQGTEGGTATENSASVESRGWEQGQHVVNIHQGVAGTATGSWVIVDQTPGETLEMQSDVFQGVQGGKSTNDGARIVQWVGKSQAEVRQGSGGSAESVGNRAEVDQWLTIFPAYASIFQGVDGGNATESWAEIEQGELLRGDALAVIKQGVGEGSVSSGDRATVSQEAANGASAYVEQGSHGGVATDNEVTVTQGAGRVWIYQGDRGTAEANSATITQRISGNASVSQGTGRGTSTGNEISIVQEGGSMELYQGDNSGTAHGNTATITQEGGNTNLFQGFDGGTATNNSVAIAQEDGSTFVLQGADGTAANNNVTIMKDNSGSTLVIQGAGNGVEGGGGTSVRNYVTVIQEGGRVEVMQGVADNGVGGISDGATANIEQRDDAEASVYQGVSRSGAVFVGAFGDAPDASITQTAEGAFAEIEQAVVTSTYSESSGDVAVIVQNAAATAAIAQARDGFSNNSMASITQDGAGSAYVLQGVDGGSANNSSATVYQDGSSIVYINQGVGTATALGAASVSQLGDGHEATINQSGDGNVATVSQGF